MSFLDILTVLSYIALNIDIVLQIKRIHKTKSSEDLSLTGLVVRYLAILIIMYKFLTLKDLPLILGQALIVVTFTIYLILAILYFLRRKKPVIK